MGASKDTSQRWFMQKNMTKIPSVEEIVDEFNQFIEKWTGSSFAHLIDTDENDGERFRQRLNTYATEQRTALLTELLEYIGNLKGVYSAHDVEEDIKAHINNLISPTNI